MINAIWIVVAVLVIISVARDLFKKKAMPQVTWGTCWFCSSVLGNDASLARLHSHCYAPICPRCASKREYGKYVIKGRSNA